MKLYRVALISNLCLIGCLTILSAGLLFLAFLVNFLSSFTHEPDTFLIDMIAGLILFVFMCPGIGTAYALLEKFKFAHVMAGVYNVIVLLLIIGFSILRAKIFLDSYLPWLDPEIQLIDLVHPVAIFLASVCVLNLILLFNRKVVNVLKSNKSIPLGD